MTYFAEYVKATLLRLAIIYSSYRNTIADRMEISTPINSWKRILEGVYLHNNGVDPYSGDLFHESPLTLRAIQLLIKYCGQYLEFIFIVIDLVTAYLLCQTAKVFVERLKNEEDNTDVSKKSKYLLLTKDHVEVTPKYVLYAYLYNPYIVLNCVSYTTTGFVNLCLAGVLYGLVYKHLWLCVVLLSWVILQTQYPILLIVPVCLTFYNDSQKISTVVKLLVSFSITLGGLFYSCYYVTGNWSFLQSTFGFVLNVNDLRPNIGLFWYFFTEMFEHFRLLFICALQINATILYLVPLAIHLRNEPIFLYMILTAITAIFKSYPSLGDVGFYLALLPLWNHLFLFMQQGFVVGCIFIITSVLGPIFWHLWIYTGSANANFYFGVTLAFATAQIFLITDLLFAHKKREFGLKHGWPYDATKTSLALD